MNEYSDSYIDQFLRLRCASDVLESCGTLNRAAKEISESMALIRQIRGYALKQRMKAVLVDLCAGNALTSILAIHLLPFKSAIAIDRKPRVRRMPHRFAYLSHDIESVEHIDLLKDIPDPIVVVASHPCNDLAKRVVDTYLKLPQAVELAFLPCCIGRVENFPGRQLWVERFGKYEAWAHQLAIQAQGNFYLNHKCLSPCRAVVWARKNYGDGQ